MAHLNPALDTPAAWNENRAQELGMTVGIPLEEIELVRRIAHRDPTLDRLGPRIDEMLRIAYADFWSGPFWTDLRNAIVARGVGLRAPVLRATDRIASDILARFLSGLGPGAQLAFDPQGHVLVGEGGGNPGDYLAWPSGIAGAPLPITLIKMPESAFWSAQRWMALAHEVGHSLFAGIVGLGAELEAALEQRMREAVASKEVVVRGIDATLPSGVRIFHDAEELLPFVWRTWADEAQADVVGVLTGGAAAIAEGQVVLGFSPASTWKADDQGDRPEGHPIACLRQWLQLSILRRMGGHSSLADELERRMGAVGGSPTEIVFTYSDEFVTLELLRDDLAPWLKSAEIAAEVFFERRLASLGNKTYGDIVCFSPADQLLAERVTDALLHNRTDFLAGSPVAQPVHAMAAAVWAHERAPQTDVTWLLQHFLV